MCEKIQGKCRSHGYCVNKKIKCKCYLRLEKSKLSLDSIYPSDFIHGTDCGIDFKV